MSEAEQVEQVDDALSVEQEAKQLGWHALDDDYKGDPDKALGAQEFIDKMKDSDVLMRSNFKKLQKTVAATANELQQVKDDTANYIDMAMAAKNKELEDVKRKAVVDGDMEAYDGAKKEQEEIKKPQPSNAPPPEVQDFVNRNPWYNRDPLKRAYAESLDKTTHGENLTEHFAFIEKEVEKRFETKIQQPHVEGGGRKKGGGKKTKTYEAMPEEFRATCDRMEKHGIKKENFVKNYWKGQDNA